MDTDGDYLYVIGGRTASGIEPSVIRLNLAIAGSVWGTITPLPSSTYELSSWGCSGGYLYALLSNGSTYRLNLANPTGAWEVLTPFPASAVYQQGAMVGGYWYVCGGAIPGTVTPYQLNLANPNAAWEALPTLAVTSSHLHLLGMDTYIYVFAAAKTCRMDTDNTTAGWDDLGVADLPAARVLMGVGVWNSSIVLVGGTTDTTDRLAGMILWRSPAVPESVSRIYDLGRTILLDMPRYGYTGGRDMRIIGTEADYRARTITLDLWG